MAQAASGVSTPAGEQAVLGALGSQLARAAHVVNSTKQHAEALGAQVRALKYPNGRGRVRAVGFGTGGAPEAPSPPDPLKPGQVKDPGPVAGTGANPGRPGIGSADLGRSLSCPTGARWLFSVIRSPVTRWVTGTHYRSVAVPVTGFDDQGRPIFGQPLTGPVGMWLAHRRLCTLSRVMRCHHRRRVVHTIGKVPSAQSTLVLGAPYVHVDDRECVLLVGGPSGLWMRRPSTPAVGHWDNQ
jgi:hypothetical protein